MVIVIETLKPKPRGEMSCSTPGLAGCRRCCSRSRRSTTVSSRCPGPSVVICGHVDSDDDAGDDGGTVHSYVKEASTPS